MHDSRLPDVPPQADAADRRASGGKLVAVVIAAAFTLTLLIPLFIVANARGWLLYIGLGCVLLAPIGFWLDRNRRGKKG